MAGGVPLKAPAEHVSGLQINEAGSNWGREGTGKGGRRMSVAEDPIRDFCRAHSVD